MLKTVANASKAPRTSKDKLDIDVITLCSQRGGKRSGGRGTRGGRLFRRKMSSWAIDSDGNGHRTYQVYAIGH
jgi:hypothetical protein